ncbi:hypothetical protein [Pseudomonas sp. Root401]|uniref:hypothetical protein n=1 Tax=Pseudomonas sp. Root401 TaxID=1736526 RepID=UPI0012E37E07|nr:hypothetical protein [Pseudomonas sp. Root401]
MKGRRKLKTSKWLLVERFRTEAVLSGGWYSENQRRFIRVAADSGTNLEPTGKMAGVSKPMISSDYPDIS